MYLKAMNPPTIRIAMAIKLMKVIFPRWPFIYSS